MSRYIDAEPYSGCRIVANREDGGIAICEVKTVDVIPVVRCRDCKHARIPPAATNDVFCGYLTKWHKKDDFCSYGERKDNE